MITNINPISNRVLPYYPYSPWSLRTAPGAFWQPYNTQYFGYPYYYPVYGGMFRGFAYPWMFRYIGRGRGRGRGFGRYY